MATWRPPLSSVGPYEKIGRRLFDEPMLKGAAGQPSFSRLKISHFEERGNEVSLDRLGATGIDGKVKKYLVPRAVAHGQTFAKPQRFDGWAVVSAKELTKVRQGLGLPVIASPVNNPEPKDNIYHAHIVRPESYTSLLMATYLSYIFEAPRGTVEESGIQHKPWRDRLLAFPITNWILAKLASGPKRGGTRN